MQFKRTITLCIAAFTTLYGSAQIINNYAGVQFANSYGGDGGLATAASLKKPLGVALNAAGDLYIADSQNYRVRMVAAGTGIITTVAGTGVAGFSGDGGLATAAQIMMPAAVATDTAGNLYIADAADSRIRKVTASTGIITTITGNGTYGYGGDGGLATAAVINIPTGIACDVAGNIYFADCANNRVRKISTSGTITTVAGTGTNGYGGDSGLATAAQLAFPNRVAVDAAGNLYICEGATRIRKVDAITGIISTIAGSLTTGYSVNGGYSVNALLNQPSGMAVDAIGNLYLADMDNHRIRVITPYGIIATIAGTGASGWSGNNGFPTLAALQHPADVAVDATGRVFIADQSNDVIRSFCNTGTVVISASPVCAGNTVTLTATASNSTASTFSWSSFLWGSSQTTVSSIVIQPMFMGTYSVTSFAACNNYSPVTTAVNLSLTPSPTVNVISNTLSLCLGGTVNLTASGATNYTWNTTPSYTTTNISVTPTLSGSYTFAATGTATNSCRNTASVVVSVNPIPTVSINNSSSAVCVGSSATLTASGAATYSWSNNAQTGTIIVVTPTANTNYTVTGKTAFGCVDTETTALQVNPLPTVSIAASTNTLCAGNSAILQVTSNAPTYTWSENNNTSSAISVTPNTNATYSVTVTNTNNCTNVAVQSVTVLGLPTLSITSSNSTGTICMNTSVTLNASGANTYTWAGENFFNQATQTITVWLSATTAYTISGTDDYGCVGKTNYEQFVSNCTGFEEFKTESLELNVYPNPNNGAFTLELNNGANKTIELLDLTGRIIFSNSTSDDKINFNIRELSNGVYYLKVMSNNAVKVLKVVKE
ncbi:MAG: T9SS type A sorting domain-containing protein [Bacteroidetes bacterium]|nr:T9SS type A sorting domain-containing protein [Bacteroidota bacterium]